MTTQENKPRRSHKGFMLVIAVSFATGLVSLVIGLYNVSIPQNRLSMNQKDQIMARQLANWGVARAVADARELGRITPDPLLDFDRLLDRNADSISTNPSTFVDDFLPNWADGTVMSIGVHDYQMVKVDLDGNGIMDGVYLVRFDDNRDDNQALACDNSTTNNTPCPGCMLEGDTGTGDNPRRDRDRSFFITAIGLVPERPLPMASTPDLTKAKSRHTLRAVIGPPNGGGRAVMTRGDYNPGGGGNQQLCGNGAIVCGNITSAPTCWCGTIVIGGSPGSLAVGSPGPCATPSPCEVCEPQQIVAATTECPVPLPPTVPTKDFSKAEVVNNLSETAGCQFFLSSNKNHTGAAGTSVYMWDTNANPACAGYSASSTVPAPDFAPLALTWPNDCWVPVFSSSDTSKDYNGGSWAPGRFNGSIPVLDKNPAGARTTGLASTATTYEARCGCTAPACNSGNSNNHFVANTLTLRKGLKGFFYHTGNLTVNGAGLASNVLADMAVTVVGAATINAGVHTKAPAGNYAVTASGNVVGNGTISLAPGLYAGGAVTLGGGNNSKIRGNVHAIGSIDVLGNNHGLCGTTDMPTASATNTCLDTPPQCTPSQCVAPGLALYRSNVNVTLEKNNYCSCINIEAQGDVAINGNSNNGTLGGSVWAGGYTTGNNFNHNPIGGGNLTAGPPDTTITYVQSLPN